MFNFHSEIALPLEIMAKEESIRLADSEVKADDIETGAFVEVMLSILSKAHKTDKDFSVKCFPYKGKTASEINGETAEELFDEFRVILKTPKLDTTQVITTCPECGCDITEANNAGNGFCLDCIRNGLADQ